MFGLPFSFCNSSTITSRAGDRQPTLDARRPARPARTPARPIRPLLRVGRAFELDAQAARHRGLAADRFTHESEGAGRDGLSSARASGRRISSDRFYFDLVAAAQIVLQLAVPGRHAFRVFVAHWA